MRARSCPRTITDDQNNVAVQTQYVSITIPDSDGDGINDDADKCPDEPEDKDGFEDEDGCPDPDNDKDSIPDVSDKCPNEPETINGIDDDDGCPDKGEPAVHIGKEELETLKPVFFETDPLTLPPRFWMASVAWSRE